MAVPQRESDVKTPLPTGKKILFGDGWDLKHVVVKKTLPGVYKALFLEFKDHCYQRLLVDFPPECSKIARTSAVAAAIATTPRKSHDLNHLDPKMRKSLANGGFSLRFF